MCSHNHNLNLTLSRTPLESQEQGTRLVTSAATNQRDCSKGSPWYAQVRFPKGQRRQSSCCSSGCCLDWEGQDQDQCRYYLTLRTLRVPADTAATCER